MARFIYSTVYNNQKFLQYKTYEGTGHIYSEMEKEVIILGLQSEAYQNKKDSSKEKGYAVTELTEEQYELVESSSIFKQFVKDGFFAVSKKELKGYEPKVTANDPSLLRDVKEYEKDAKRSSQGMLNKIEIKA